MAEEVHWKALEDPLFLGSWFLKEGEEKVLTIADVIRNKAKNDKGKVDEVTVVTFVEKGVKPMIINATNAKTITRIYGSPYLKDWVGKKIQIYVLKDVEAFGEKRDVLRVRAYRPELPWMGPDHKRWPEVVAKIAAGSTTLEAVKKSFQIKPEHAAQLVRKL